MPVDYYVIVKLTATDYKDYNAQALIQEACRIKPNTKHPLGLVKLKVKVSRTKALDQPLWRMASCIHDYVFLSGNNVNVSADADMLLTGPVKDITFGYFLLRRLTIMHLPHLFEGDSPVLLLALLLQDSATVTTLLTHSGVTITEALSAKAARMLQLNELQHGGTGWQTAFDEIREIMKNRWHSTLQSDYKGYNADSTYRNRSTGSS